MDIVASIAVIVSGIGTLAHVYFDYKKSKQPKRDIIWDTALQLVTKSETYVPAADVFIETYEDLKAFHDNGCMRISKRTSAESQAEPHATK